MKIGREFGSGGVACGSGGAGFWARVWILNEETFKLERVEQKNERSVNRHFFRRYSAFSCEGLQKIPASCKPASHLVRVFFPLVLSSSY